MVNRNIVEKLGLSNDEIEKQVNEMFTDEHNELLNEVLGKKVDDLLPGTIISGKIVTQLGNDVIVELGLKSEGIVNSQEFDDPEEIVAGKEIEVLLEEVDAEGSILLSKRKADRIRGWDRIIENNKEGDIVSGRVTRRIKGGLLVDIGVPVFLPASQVDIRKPGDISRFIGRDIECKILKIDTENHNIVVSRRKIIEEDRNASKEKLLEDIEVGQFRKGVVKNIADFGVFVDLGGLDGLLHISDLSWGRISHPSEVVHLDQEIECVVIGVDKGNEKISLGLKQKAQSPWETVKDRYVVGSRVTGTVVNIMNYGVFVRLEEGIEGLVHISEMSWTRRIIHPADMLNLGDDIEVVVLDVDKDKQEISLGIKQLETNPWSVAAQKYPTGTIVTTRVTSLTNYGAFVEIEPGIDGLVHISDLSWTKKYNHPADALQKGQELKCVVLDVDEGKRRVSLGVKQMTEDPWLRAIPDTYIPGQIVKGHVTKITNFGVFVELEKDLEGLLHISELADHKINSPQDVVSLGQELEVKILRVDNDSRKIGLSLRRVQWAAEEQQKQADNAQATEEKGKPQRRGGLDGSLMPDSIVVPSTIQPQPQKAEAEESAKKDAEATDKKDEQKAEEPQPVAEEKPDMKTDEVEGPEEGSKDDNTQEDNKA
jgi:small subunit ribosomal protein S1